MSDLEQHNADVQFMKECVTSEVIKLIMEEQDLGIEEAIHQFYTSKTFAKLDNEQTKLYTQGPVYVLDEYNNEIKLSPMK